MRLSKYAELELARIPQDEDGLQSLINKYILKIVNEFEDFDLSGSAAGYVLSALERLLRFKPISPLTGEDDEWYDEEFGSVQNKRCPSVFKRPDGTCYDVDAIIVSDDGGITWFISNRFRKEVTFPYIVPTHPEKVYIEYTKDVPHGCTDDVFEIITDNPDRIKSLYERKRK